MAEIVGATASVITLAGLFKICIEAFDFIRCAKNQEIELKKLNLKLRIEKCRLFVWGQSMGLGSEDGGGGNLLDDCPFSEVVQEALQQILQLLTDSESLTGKYGCRRLETGAGSDRLLEADIATPAGKLTAAFDRFKISTSAQDKASRMRGMAMWVIHDRKKFALLAREAKEFIDGLQDITQALVSRQKQEQLMTSRIITIHDQETLTMISEVCDTDHPKFSGAASGVSASMSMPPSRKRDVSNWIDHTEAENETFALTENMEEWTITEYRQNFLDLLRERGQGWQPPPPVYPCYDCGMNLPTRGDWEQHVKKEESRCSFCHTDFECHGLLMEHGCFSRRKQYEGTFDSSTIQSSDEQERKDLKAQLRLLRNRKASLESRRRKKSHAEKRRQEDLLQANEASVVGSERPWLPEEDQKLLHLVRLHGPNNWLQISQHMEHRSQEQCRDRYHQNLDPSCNHESVSADVVDVKEQLVQDISQRGEMSSRISSAISQALTTSQVRPSIPEGSYVDGKPSSIQQVNQELKGVVIAGAVEEVRACNGAGGFVDKGRRNSVVASSAGGTDETRSDGPDAISSHGPHWESHSNSDRLEPLLNAGATWDLVQAHELVRKGLVDIGDVVDRLKAVARTNEQGLVFHEGDVRQAIVNSTVAPHEQHTLGSTPSQDTAQPSDRRPSELFETNHEAIGPPTPGELVTPNQMPTNLGLSSTRRFSSTGAPGSPLFECLDCGKMFTNDRDWEWHISRERRRCVSCNRLFECYERFLVHIPNCDPAAVPVAIPAY